MADDDYVFPIWHVAIDEREPGPDLLPADAVPPATICGRPTVYRIGQEWPRPLNPTGDPNWVGRAVVITKETAWEERKGEIPVGIERGENVLLRRPAGEIKQRITNLFSNPQTAADLMPRFCPSCSAAIEALP